MPFLNSCMSIKDAINSGIKVGDSVEVSKKIFQFGILQKPISGKLQYINLDSGSDPPNPTITISCLDDKCKQSKDRYGSNVTSSKSFGNDYCVKLISPTTGGKSRKYKKSRKSKKSKKSRKSRK